MEDNYNSKNIRDDKHMTTKQYNLLTKSISKLESKIGDIADSLNSIQIWISGDSNIPSTTGSHQKIKHLDARISALENDESFQRLERKVDRIYFVAAGVGLFASFLGSVAGLAFALWALV